MPVAVPGQDEIDDFLPPRTDPLQIVDPADPRNIGPVTLADPRADADGVVRPGYMDLRGLHQKALLEALEVIPRVDADFAETVGRAWGGLTWEYLLEDADVVLVAAGSIATELTATADALRAEGVKVGVLGIRTYRPFPAAAIADKLCGRKLVLAVDKAVSYGYEGPICTDLRAAVLGTTTPPAVFGAIAGLGGRDVSPDDLSDATRRAIADMEAGIASRPTDWIRLKQEG
jgi:pyruvate ferredoxin oxidoreductase alpha subunit